MKATYIPPYSEVVGEIEKNCKDEIRGLLEKYYEKISPNVKRILSKTYKMWMYIMLITVIIFFIMYMIRRTQIDKITTLVKTEIGNFEVYQAALKGTNISEAKQVGRISSGTHWTLRCSPVPADAIVYRVSNGLKCGSLKKTDLITNSVTFRWVRRTNKSTQVYYYTQAMMIVGLDFMKSFSFNLLKGNRLFSKLTRREKTQLENSEFEKMFSIQNNDEVKLRQVFTLMVQENYVKYNKERSLKDLKIVKSGDLLYIVWGTNNNYLTVQGSKLKDSTSEDILEMVWSNVRDDLSQFYTAAAYACSLPFYNDKVRTKQPDIETENTNARLKRGFIYAALRELNEDNNDE